MTIGVPAWILWNATMRAGADAREKIDAAAASGFPLLSLSPSDVVHAAAAGCPPRELVVRAADRGVRIACLDPLYDWVEPRDRSADGKLDAERVVRLAEELGATSLNALVGSTTLPDDALVERFGELCDRCAGFGCRVHIESSPLSATFPSVAEAWRVVRAADRSNGGLLVDSWHFFRGAGRLDDLARVPGERVFAVQLSDAARAMRGDLWNDTLHHRRLPGDGDLDLVGFVSVLDRIGGLQLVGPEVISDELHAREPAEAASLAGDRSEQFVSAVLGRTTARNAIRAS